LEAYASGIANGDEFKDSFLALEITLLVIFFLSPIVWYYF
jgi:hypothetical protein